MNATKKSGTTLVLPRTKYFSNEQTKQSKFPWYEIIYTIHTVHVNLYCGVVYGIQPKTLGSRYMSKNIEIHAEPIRLGYKTHNPYLNRTNLNECHPGVTTITKKKQNHDSDRVSFLKEHCATSQEKNVSTPTKQRNRRGEVIP